MTRAHRGPVGVPEVHFTGAADELVRHLAAQPDAFSEASGLMMLAYAGALAMVSRAELDESSEVGPGL